MNDKSQIEEIKSKLDITSVVSEYVPNLKRSGNNSFGLCPFHKEKTPSFSVNSDLGLFKCFGCGEGGDVIKFLQKIEGLDFPNALELAAKKAGVVLKKRAYTVDSKVQKEKERLLNANHLTAEFYNYVLCKHKLGEAGREYAKSRKIEGSAIEKYLIGFAPKGFENLKNFLLKKGFKEDELVKWGLLVNKKGRVYDKFRNRLMFTIFNHQGDVIGFSGRLIDKNELGPKYLNSPETLVYKKSQVLYGLYQAKESIRKNDFVVIVEGNIDILTASENGIPNIVAPLGTALTLEQLELLKRYTNKIYFALDTDEAGQKALKRSIGLANELKMESYVMVLGEYKDLDELIVNGGDVNKVIKGREEFVIYFMKSLQNKYNLKNTVEKTEYIREILSLLSLIDDALLKSDYLKKLEGIVGINMKILGTELLKLTGTDKKEVKEDEIIDSTNMATKDLIAKSLLALIYQYKRYKNEIKEICKDEVLPNSKYKNVFRGIWDPDFARKLSSEEQEIFFDIQLMRVDDKLTVRAVIKQIALAQNRLEKRSIQEKLEKLKYENLDDLEKAKQMKELTSELSKLK